MNTPIPGPRVDDLIDREAAAQIMDCHPNTLDRLVSAGILHKYRLHGKNRVFFDRAEVEACTEPIPVEEP